jgi:hypothetical protein
LLQLVTTLGCNTGETPPSITVAAASNLSEAFNEIGSEFYDSFNDRRVDARSNSAPAGKGAGGGRSNSKVYRNPVSRAISAVSNSRVNRPNPRSFAHVVASTPI